MVRKKITVEALGIEVDEPRVATNGLHPDQEAALEHCLRKLQALDSRRGIMGSNEATAIVRLMNEIKTRISPPTPQELQGRTEKIIAGFRPASVPWVRELLEGVSA
jgi:hypothetical protein